MKGTREELLGQLRVLQPFVETVESKGFIGWRDHIEKELKLLEDWSWRVTSEPPPLVQQALVELGLPTPKNTVELHECWLAFRSARNYMSAKLKWLDGRVRLSKVVQAQLDKGERND